MASKTNAVRLVQQAGFTCEEKFYDYEDPVKTIHTQADGMVSYKALLFIPGHAPFDYFTKDFED